jgi:hypothetical protein
LGYGHRFLLLEALVARNTGELPGDASAFAELVE